MLDGAIQTNADFTPRFRLGWNDQGLLALVTVRDDEFVEADSISDIWRHDCIELFACDRWAGRQLVQCVISPGMAAGQSEHRVQAVDRRRDRSTAFEPQTARSTGDGFYTVEVLLPWSALHVQPMEGLEIGFQVYISDDDPGEPRRRAAWYPRTGVDWNTALMHRLRLAPEPSPPVLADASARYEQMKTVRIAVCADPQLEADAVETWDGARRLGAFDLVADGDQQYARIDLPMPPLGDGYGSLSVKAAGQIVRTLDLPNADGERVKALMQMELAFTTCVFDSDEFPGVELVRPLWVERLLGGYSVTVDYYDAAYQPVTRASAPGRYGAVVTITAGNGWTFRRYRTLFRTPQGLSWWSAGFEGKLQLARAFGIDPAVVEAYDGYLLDQLTWMAQRDSMRSDRLARLLAGLYEAKADDTTSVYTDPSATDEQWWVGLTRKLNGNDQRFDKPLVCPRPVDGAKAPQLRDGSPAEAGMVDDAAEKIDAVCRAWAADSDEPFTVCVARRGVILLHRSYAPSGETAPPLTRMYWMASLTKLFSGSVFMMLMDQGLIELDDPIENFLPVFAHRSPPKPVTMRHLLTHTAGTWGSDKGPDVPEIWGPYYPYLAVGKAFDYNGTGVTLALNACEQITGESLTSMYQRHLLQPLGMARTNVTDATGNGSAAAHDVAVFGQMLLNGGAYGAWRFFSPETRDRMLPQRLEFTDQPDAMPLRGVGTMAFSAPGISERVLHHGAASCSQLVVDLDNDLVVVMLRDQQGANFYKYNHRFFSAITSSFVERADEGS